MNESTLTQLKIIVERVVRPVRATTPRKRKMRHLIGALAQHSRSSAPAFGVVNTKGRLCRHLAA